MIRAFAPADASAAASIARAANPHWLWTGPSVRHEFESQPARARPNWLVAVEGDEVVGWAAAGLTWQVATPGVAELWVGVRQDREGEGIGRELFDRSETHLRACGARKVTSYAFPGSRGERFATARGFATARWEQLFDIDLGAVDLPPASPPTGSEIVKLAQLRNRLHELYELFVTVEAGMPTDEPWTGSSFEEWEGAMWRSPHLDEETSVVALVDGRAVAMSWLLIAGRFAEIEMTGTLPEFRRRGLARAAKLESMRLAAGRGVERIVTGTDFENTAMLALNDALEFRRTAVQLELSKLLE
ncbi:MAG TPA: GNAT family N-acetyltransferase [Gaiellaceae bacterium]|nr:GNAT family N-acetyltransferase [Gaiellaceae bacterium]